MEKAAGIYPRNTDQEGNFQSGLPEILKHFWWSGRFFCFLPVFHYMKGGTGQSLNRSILSNLSSEEIAGVDLDIEELFDVHLCCTALGCAWN